MIALIVVASIMLYMVGIGVTQPVLFKYTETMDREDCWMVSIFFWYLALPVVVAQATIKGAFRRAKEKNRLSNEQPIVVKDGAKIETMEQYKRLKSLCTEFEVEFEANKEVENLLGCHNEDLS